MAVAPLRIGISPCPNDTFIWAGLALGKVSAPIPLEFVYEDIEALNVLAQREVLDLVKVSFLQYGLLPFRRYQLMPVGTALGYGVGPIVVARTPLSYADLVQARIGIPGWHTTAHSLFHFYVPEANRRYVYRYDQLLPALLAGEIEAAVIIHELRFTYQAYDLVQIVDLGTWWTARHKIPIPLGGVVLHCRAKRWQRALTLAVRQSLSWARRNPTALWTFVQKHASELDPQVQKAHIDLYVNRFSWRLGLLGRKAIRYYINQVQAMTPFLSRCV